MLSFLKEFEEMFSDLVGGECSVRHWCSRIGMVVEVSILRDGDDRTGQEKIGRMLYPEGYDML